MAFNIKDVAKLAGVSHTTVSRALNSPEKVKPQTLERIKKIVEETGYTPNLSARSMVGGQKYAIGLLVLYELESFPAGFLASIVEGICVELDKKGYALNIAFQSTHFGREKLPQTLGQSRVDGLLLLAVDPLRDLGALLENLSMPVVAINEPLGGTNGYVVADEAGGAECAVSHLIARGHTKILYINGTPSRSSSIQRREGYLAALKKHGLIYDKALDACANFSKEEAYTCTCGLLDSGTAFDAVFAANDLMALGAMHALQEHGRKIGKEVAVAGFDNQDFASFTAPPLTTVKKPRHQMGAEAARLILDLVAQNVRPKGSTRIVLPARLIVREST